MVDTERFALISEPAFAVHDRAWIDRARRQYDPLATLVPPHVTLVFPLAGIGRAALRAHVARVLETSPPIQALFAGLEVFDDPLSGDSYLFLVPDQGAGALAALHDRLYEGPLAPRLRLDIPYRPHVTLGRFADRRAAEVAWQALRKDAIEFAARVDAVVLLRLASDTIDTIGRFDLR